MDLQIKSFHTILYCNDWKACVAFYRDTLGFEMVFSNDLFVELRIGSNAFLGLIDRFRCRRKVMDNMGVVLSFRVANLEETYKMMESGHCCPSPIRGHSWGAMLFEVKDPENRRLEFWQENNFLRDQENER